MPRVSIIMPTFNRAYCLTRAIKSVMLQTFTDWELIIVDDGSTDETSQILDRFSQTLRSRFRHFKIENSGAAKARNAGIVATSSEFVAFIDSDDIWLPEKLDMQISRLSTNAGVDFSFTDYFEFSDEHGIGKLGHAIPSSLVGNIYPQLLDVSHNLITCPSVVVRRSLLDDCGLFDESMRICEDIDLWRRIARRTQVDAIPVALVGVNIRQASSFPYKSSLEGRLALYRNSRRDDPSLDARYLSRLYKEILSTYQEVAIHRRENRVSSLIGSALRSAGSDLDKCEAEVEQLVHKLTS